VHGELASTEAIPDLDKARRNDRGKVQYASDIMLPIPADLSKGKDKGFLQFSLAFP